MSEDEELRKFFGKNPNEVHTADLKEFEIKTRVLAKESPDESIRKRSKVINDCLRREMKSRGLTPIMYPYVEAGKEKSGKVPNDVAII